MITKQVWYYRPRNPKPIPAVQVGCDSSGAHIVYVWRRKVCLRYVLYASLQPRGTFEQVDFLSPNLELPNSLKLVTLDSIPKKRPRKTCSRN